MPPNGTDLASDGLKYRVKPKSSDCGIQPKGADEDLYEAVELVKVTSTTHFKPKIRWPDLIVQVYLHVGALYGLYYLISLQAKGYTYLWSKLACFESH